MSLVPINLNSYFPINTFITNFIGCVLIGMLSKILDKEYASEAVNLLLKVGFCGGFTTFSTFALEFHNLAKGGDVIMSFIYIFCSIFFSYIGLLLGRMIIV